MNNKNMTTKVLCFDTASKCELFAKYMGKSKTTEVFYTHNADEALRRMMKHKQDILLLGGDLEGKELRAVSLFYMMSEWELQKKMAIYITTWNENEARILKDMSKKSMYIPFCESVADIVKERSRQIRVRKKKKILQNNQNAPNNPET